MRFIPRSEEVAKTCILAVALGAVFRICPFIGRDFPVNDGGLWLRFTDALGNADFILPSAVEWNGSLLPLVYPPLGIYILAGANRVTGIEVEKLLCWIPLILSLTSIPCFVFFSYVFLHHIQNIAVQF